MHVREAALEDVLLIATELLIVGESDRHERFESDALARGDHSFPIGNAARRGSSWQVFDERSKTDRQHRRISSSGVAQASDDESPSDLAAAQKAKRPRYL